jgi:hypothetical protein
VMTGSIKPPGIPVKAWRIFHIFIPTGCLRSTGYKVGRHT